MGVQGGDNVDPAPALGAAKAEQCNLSGWCFAGWVIHPKVSDDGKWEWS